MTSEQTFDEYMAMLTTGAGDNGGEDVIKRFRWEALHCIGDPKVDWHNCDLGFNFGLGGNPGIIYPAGMDLKTPALVFIKGDPFDCTLEEACGVALATALYKHNNAFSGKYLMGVSFVTNYFVERKSALFFDMTDAIAESAL